MPISPARVLHQLNELLPRGAWERIERRRAAWVAEHGEPDRGITWWHHGPLRDACLEETSSAIHRAVVMQDMDRLTLLASANVLANWRMTRGMYDFDETLREALRETEIDRLPTDILQRLPEYAPYLTLNGYRYAGKTYAGAWVMLCTPAPDEKDSVALGKFRAAPPMLNAVMHAEDGTVLNLVLDLVADTLSECLEQTTASVTREAQRHHQMALPAAYSPEVVAADTRLWNYLLSLMLYLCSDEPDISGEIKKPAYSPKRKYAHVAVPPQQDNMLEVGFRHGGAIRMWRQTLNQGRGRASSGAGLPKAPHIRKAHFALRWTGPGREIPRIVWIAPVAVNVKDFDALPVHSRPVLDDPADAAERDPDKAWARDNQAVLSKL